MLRYTWDYCIQCVFFVGELVRDKPGQIDIVKVFVEILKSIFKVIKTQGWLGPTSQGEMSNTYLNWQSWQALL